MAAPSSKQNPTFLVPHLWKLAYMIMFFIPQLMHSATNASQEKYI